LRNYHVSKFLFEEDGCKVIAITDSKGILINEDGLAIEEAYCYKVENKTLDGFPGGRYKKGSTTRVLEMECDILIPAAVEGQISIENVDRIKARIIIEAANGPITFAADGVLNKRGVTIIPEVKKCRMLLRTDSIPVLASWIWCDQVWMILCVRPSRKYGKLAQTIKILPTIALLPTSMPYVKFHAPIWILVSIRSNSFSEQINRK
jgi:hypothetical protein